MTGGPQAYDWWVLLAILLGPLIGVWVTRLIDAAKEKSHRRWELFVTLRRTRGLELSHDYVAAINMVPVLFADDTEAMSEWGKLMTALNNPSWSSEDGTVREGVSRSAADARHNLIQRIGEVVGAKLPTKEELRLGYAPVAWEREFMEQTAARKLLLEVLSGEKPLRMIAGVYDVTAESPPPEEEPKEEPKELEQKRTARRAKPSEKKKAGQQET